MTSQPGVLVRGWRDVSPGELTQLYAYGTPSELRLRVRARTTGCSDQSAHGTDWNGSRYPVRSTRSARVRMRGTNAKTSRFRCGSRRESAWLVNISGRTVLQVWYRQSQSLIRRNICKKKEDEGNFMISFLATFTIYKLEYFRIYSVYKNFRIHFRIHSEVPMVLYSDSYTSFVCIRCTNE